MKSPTLQTRKQTGRPTAAYLEDGSHWDYRYNDRDELISGKRYWPDWTPFSGQQFGYEFDNIGNRKRAWSGGDNQGANLRETSYTANSLNQYTDVQTPGYKHIAGAAFATNAVLVNSGTAERRGEWFDREITVANSSGPVWQTVSVTDGTVTTNGGFVFPRNAQTLTYDLDGNLAFDGIWTYEWDGENRLKAMTMTNVAGIANAQRKRLEFGYDFMNRRFSKVVKTWNGSAFTNPSTNLFLYDGWNLLAIVTPQLSTLNSFLWGQDLSGTMDGAGGVGGLLAFFEISTSRISNADFTAYDGNGNVTGLVGCSKTVTAKYEHSPFGQILVLTGPLANANPFRFSSKFHDEETGLVFYGKRYYSPELGRWLNRDPIDEGDSANLYLAMMNRPVDQADTNGEFIINSKFMAVVTLLASLFKSGGPTGGYAAMLAAEQKRIAQSIAAAAWRNKTGKGTPGAGGGKFYQAKGTPWALALTGLIAMSYSVEAAANLALGTRSEQGTSQYALESAFINYAKGESAWGDLDLIEAALLGGNFEAAEIVVAWGVFDEAAQAFGG